MAIKTFTAGSVLNAADTNTYLANSGLVYVKSQTVTGGAGVSSVTVTNAFSSTYDAYKITYTGGVQSGTAPIYLRLGPSSVPNYNTGYTTVLFYGTPAAQAFAYDAGTEFEWCGGGSTTFSQLSVEIISPFLSQNTRMHIGSYQSGTAMGTSSGIHGFTNSYTDFTIGLAVDNLIGGVITVYGYRKA